MSALSEAAKKVLLLRKAPDTHSQVEKTSKPKPRPVQPEIDSLSLLEASDSEPSIDTKVKLIFSVFLEVIMPPNSLTIMCKNKLMKEVDNLTDIGNIPFELMKPVLQRISRPDQLRRLEISCAQLRGKTGDIWMKLIQRDAGKHAESIKGADIKDWYKTYTDLKARQAVDDANAKEVLAARMSALRKQNNQNKAELDLNGTLVPENSPNRVGRKSTVVKMQEAKREAGKASSKPKPAPGSNNKPSAIQKIVADVRRDHQRMGFTGAKRKYPSDTVLVAQKKRRT